MRSIPAEWKEWAEAIRLFAHILLIWLLAWALLRSMRRVLRAFTLRIESRLEHEHDARRNIRRVETLSSVFRHTVNIVIVGMAAMLTLGEVGISILPLLATAGVAGIAIGFGAQSLVKDFLAGLFLLLENQVNEGDMIEAAGKSGHVERLSLRHIRIRDYEGNVHFIPNGMITTVTNKSREYGFAVIDMTVGKQEDIERVFAAMREVGAALRDDPLYGPAVLEDVDIAGVEKVEDAAITLRCRLKVMPEKQWSVRREFLRRMKPALDAHSQAGSAS